MAALLGSTFLVFCVEHLLLHENLLSPDINKKILPFHCSSMEIMEIVETVLL